MHNKKKDKNINKKHGDLYGVRVMLPLALLEKLQEESVKEDRKLSAMMRRILENHYQQPMEE